MIHLAELQKELGLDPDQMRVALNALEEAGYLDVTYTGGAGINGVIEHVTERTRRELGSWPSADSVLEQLVVALAAAADAEPEPERKGRLRAAAELLGGMARDVAVQAISAQLGRAG